MNSYVDQIDHRWLFILLTCSIVLANLYAPPVFRVRTFEWLVLLIGMSLFHRQEWKCILPPTYKGCQCPALIIEGTFLHLAGRRVIGLSKKEPI